MGDGQRHMYLLAVSRRPLRVLMPITGKVGSNKSESLSLSVASRTASATDLNWWGAAGVDAEPGCRKSAAEHAARVRHSVRWRRAVARNMFVGKSVLCRVCALGFGVRFYDVRITCTGITFSSATDSYTTGTLHIYSIIQ